MSTALLIIDVQQALCTGVAPVLEAAPVIQRINQASAWARSQGMPVIFVQHEEAAEPWCFDCPGWQLAKGLHAMAHEPRVRKQTPDAFNQTELEGLLKARGITRLLVCGMQSDFCVDTSVRRALSLGYDVVLLGDAHTSVDNGVLTAAQIIAHHNATFASMTSFGPRIRVMPVAALYASAIR
ncbi:cysteine hydrolase [Pseudomonas sp. MAFF212428]|uniref:Cysteine hydrolase n=1 Tax=Pseudomonas brassicae TaxID=2708063 RepID=A0A6B3NZV4_9PSED|nr:cysteine hydrolase family protein [Pseudomonas brassicae]NER58800.1 cysteine hydrolase [Pseudomonas brassicae]NER65758.1 cysteine hydrolase [Pseudomonas brassicae]